MTVQGHDSSLDKDDDDDGIYDPFTFERIGTRERSTPRAAPSEHERAVTAWFEAELAKADARDADRERRRRLQALAAAAGTRRTYPLDLGRERGTSAPLCVRVPRWLEQQVRTEFAKVDVGLSDGLRQILEEWWVTRHYPDLEYRAEEFIRLAAIHDGPSIIEWLKATPRPPLSADVLEQVLDYVELFRSRLEAELARRS